MLWSACFAPSPCLRPQQLGLDDFAAAALATVDKIDPLIEGSISIAWSRNRLGAELTPRTGTPKGDFSACAWVLSAGAAGASFAAVGLKRLATLAVGCKIRSLF